MLNFISFTDDKLLKFYNCVHKNAQNNHLHTCGDSLTFYTFQQSSAPAHTACKMVEFLNCEMPDFMPPRCLCRYSEHFSSLNIVDTTLQNSFSLTFQDKMNHFPWLICSCEISTLAFNRLQSH